MTNPTDYHTAIDEQLLAVALAKSDGTTALPAELEATRVKLEEIAHAAAMSKQLQQQHQQLQHQHHQQHQIHQHQQHQLLQHQQQALQQQQFNQLRQQLQQQLLQPQLHQLHHQQFQHHQQHQQHQQLVHQLHHQVSQQQYDDDPSQYNIQIPDPIIDSKLRIYPVSENTITAEGNLITRPYPEQIFQNRDDLNEFIHEFARDNGFGVVIAHSNKKAIYYTCELGGRYRHKKSKKSSSIGGADGSAGGADEVDVDSVVDESLENGYLLDPTTKTKKLRCPFSMTANFKKSTGVWTLRTTCNEHNHPQLDPLSNHPMLRKRSDELNLLILDLYKIGTKPSHIESKIKDQYPDVLIKREDIYNEIRGYKRKLKKQSRFLSNSSNRQNNLYKKRSNASSFQQVDLDDDDTLDQVLDYELHHSQQDVELQRQLHQAAQQQHLQQHQHIQQQQHQIDEQQLQQYQQQLQEHDLHHPDDSENTAAAAIAAVASATQQHQQHHHQHEGEISMDNIDSRLVGE